MSTVLLNLGKKHLHTLWWAHKEFATPVNTLFVIKLEEVKGSGRNRLLNFLFFLQASWRKVVATGVTLGIPTPAFSTALAFYDGYRSEWLPANLLQVKASYMIIVIISLLYHNPILVLLESKVESNHFITWQFSSKCSRKILHSSSIRVRYGEFYVSS